jgi:hypothetical protein
MPPLQSTFAPKKSKEEEDGLVWLLVGALGFFFGVSLISGPLSWYFGRKLRLDCENQGKAVPDVVRAAGIVGMITTILTVVVGLAVIAGLAVAGLAFVALLGGRI